MAKKSGVSLTTLLKGIVIALLIVKLFHLESKTEGFGQVMPNGAVWFLYFPSTLVTSFLLIRHFAYRRDESGQALWHLVDLTLLSFVWTVVVAVNSPAFFEPKERSWERGFLSYVGAVLFIGFVKMGLGYATTQPVNAAAPAPPANTAAPAAKTQGTTQPAAPTQFGKKNKRTRKR